MQAIVIHLSRRSDLQIAQRRTRRPPLLDVEIKQRAT